MDRADLDRAAAQRYRKPPLNYHDRGAECAESAASEARRLFR